MDISADTMAIALGLKDDSYKKLILEDSALDDLERLESKGESRAAFPSHLRGPFDRKDKRQDMVSWVSIRLLYLSWS